MGVVQPVAHLEASEQPETELSIPVRLPPRTRAPLHTFARDGALCVALAAHLREHVPVRLIVRDRAPEVRIVAALALLSEAELLQSVAARALDGGLRQQGGASGVSGQKWSGWLE